MSWANEASLYMAEMRAGVYDEPETEPVDPDWLYESKRDEELE